MDGAADPRSKIGTRQDAILHFDAGFCLNFYPAVVTTFFEIAGTGQLVDHGQDGGAVTHGPAWLRHTSDGIDQDAFLGGERGDVVVDPKSGQQLIDLWAAHRALTYLIANGFHGAAELVGDGKDVIGFLRGDNGLNLNVDDSAFSAKLKSRIIDRSASLDRVGWKWVRHDGNRAANLRQNHAKDYCLRLGGAAVHHLAVPELTRK